MTDAPAQPKTELPLPNIPLIHRPDDVPSQSALPRPSLAGRKRVLIVDDEQPVLKLVVRIIANDNYEIRSADSGVTAARLLDEPDFPGVDLLITDLMMPGMNGRELAAAVKAKHPAARVLFVTGFADNLFTGLHELGAGESFIEKPFGAEGLLEAARLLMFGHIADGQVPVDKRDDEAEWEDNRLRTKIVRVLKRWKLA
ncbi:MAG: response regulator [Acidobacteriota bacterium]|nr:response regulator [Acidobacteriota bacterium]